MSNRARLARDGLPALLRRRGHLLRLRHGAGAGIPLRIFYGLQDFITINHLDVMGKILLATSLLTSYGYFSEQFMAWYGGEDAEHYLYLNRLIGFGQYALRRPGSSFFCNTIVPQVLWVQRLRRSQCGAVRRVAVVLVGMWLERYMIITTSLHRDYLPSSWGMFKPTIWDYLTFFGTIGLFFVAVPAVHPLPADDLDLGDARPAAGDARPRGGTMKPRTADLRPDGRVRDGRRQILAATRRARQAGYRDMDAYTPYPVEGLAEELGLTRTRVPFVVLVGGLVGAAVGFFMQYWYAWRSIIRSTSAAGRSTAGRCSFRSPSR